MKILNKPKSGGKSTEFGAGDFISAAMGPRRTVGVHACCLTPILCAIIIISYCIVIDTTAKIRMLCSWLDAHTLSRAVSFKSIPINVKKCFYL